MNGTADFYSRVLFPAALTLRYAFTSHSLRGCPSAIACGNSNTA